MRPRQDGDPVTIGPYGVLAKLGEGGMGEVFLGVAGDDRRIAAVKRVRAVHGRDPEFRARFARETALSRHVVDGLARVVEFDAAAEDPWLATEYVPGPTLYDVLERGGPLPVEDVHRLGRGLAGTLTRLHAMGIVHRDVKPTNVILADDGRPRLIDLGIARAADGSSTTITRTGVILGAPGYMSPEQTRSAHVDARSDVFSLGSVLYAACVGRGPFEGEIDVATLLNLVSAEPDLDPVPEPLRPIVEACLRKDVERRPTAAEVHAMFVDDGANGWSAAVARLSEERNGVVSALLHAAPVVGPTRRWPSGETVSSQPRATDGPTGRLVGDPTAGSGPVPWSSAEKSLVRVLSILGVVMLLVVVAVALAVNGDGGGDGPVNADDVTASPGGTSGTEATPSDLDLGVFADVRVGDCVEEDGFGAAELEIVRCDDDVFEVTDIVETGHTGDCRDSDTDRTAVSPDGGTVLCLTYRHPMEAYRAEEGDCVFDWETDDWEIVDCAPARFKVLDRRSSGGDCRDTDLLDHEARLEADADGLDVTLCLTYVHTDDGGRAEVDDCMYLSVDGDDHSLDSVPCDDANVVVVARSSDPDDEDFCGVYQSVWFDPNDYKEFGYRLCLRDL